MKRSNQFSLESGNVQRAKRFDFFRKPKDSENASWYMRLVPAGVVRNPHDPDSFDGSAQISYHRNFAFIEVPTPKGTIEQIMVTGQCLKVKDCPVCRRAWAHREQRTKENGGRLPSDFFKEDMGKQTDHLFLAYIMKYDLKANQFNYTSNVPQIVDYKYNYKTNACQAWDNLADVYEKGHSMNPPIDIWDPSKGPVIEAEVVKEAAEKGNAIKKNIKHTAHWNVNPSPLPDNWKSIVEANEPIDTRFSLFSREELEEIIDLSLAQDEVRSNRTLSSIEKARALGQILTDFVANTSALSMKERIQYHMTNRKQDGDSSANDYPPEEDHAPRQGTPAKGASTFAAAQREQSASPFNAQPQDSAPIVRAPAPVAEENVKPEPMPEASPFAATQAPSAPAPSAPVSSEASSSDGMTAAERIKAKIAAQRAAGAK